MGGLSMITYCGECPFFKYDDINGYMTCDINECLIVDCLTECAFRQQSELTEEQAVKVLQCAQKWGRGEEMNMPSPALLNLAIDTAIRVLKQNIKKE